MPSRIKNKPSKKRVKKERKKIKKYQLRLVSKQFEAVLDPTTTVMLARTIKYGLPMVNWRCTAGVWSEATLKDDGTYSDYHNVPDDQVPAAIRALGCN